jgi:hypothetical protein
MNEFKESDKNNVFNFIIKFNLKLFSVYNLIWIS